MKTKCEKRKEIQINLTDRWQCYCHRGSTTGPAEHLLRTRPLQIWPPLISL